jgi:hypothetical protein
MRKILPIFVVGILILSSGIFVVASNNDGTSEKIEQLAFSLPLIQDNGEYLSVTVEGANSVLLDPGNPILPAYKKTLTFPFGTSIQEVRCDITSEITYDVLSKSIETAPEPLPPESIDMVIDTDKDQQNKDIQIPFPENWLDYNIGCGLKDGEHVLFLTLQFYPVRYSSDNTICFASSAEITITYEEPTNYNPFPDTYDLLIIAPSVFSGDLQPLVDHKESKGIKTKAVSLDEIYDSTYFPVQGRDDAEKVKYFIKNAIEDWGINYVLLVGGRKPGPQENWFLPVRYVKIFWVDENRYLSDLYFADIYNGTGNFSSWDTDNNNVFGEWPEFGNLKDKMDLYPDVYLGRWACKNKFELKVMIDKTIKYENNVASEKIVVSGGDNFEDAGYEGEIVGDKALTYFPEYESKKVYASQTDVTPRNIRRAIGTGAVFVELHGHGSPYSWRTHKPNNFDTWEKGIEGINIPLFVYKEYPIVLVGGCHNAMFNVSIFNYPWSAVPFPEDLCWWIARKYGGGSIATFGYACFPVAATGESGDLDGDGINEPDCVESGYGYMELGLLKANGVEGKQYLGECWNYAVSRYIETFPMPERYDLHTIQGFVMLGDPSLKIGGYSSQGDELKASIANVGMCGYSQTSVQFQASISGGTEPYQYEWYFEDGQAGDITAKTVECKWDSPGVYWVKLKVTDANNNENTYYTIAVIESKPDGPSGSSRGRPGVEYSFTFKATVDPSWDQVYYLIDWGDDSSDALGPYPSDTPIKATHTWSSKGTYQVKVKELLISSQGDLYEETGWSDPLAVSMPRGRPSMNPLILQFLEKLLEKFPSAFPILRQLLT